MNADKTLRQEYDENGYVFMHRLAGDERLLDIVEQFIGPNIALFAAHYIAKRPYKGQAVGWHQDGSYWPLEPMEVTTLWLAGSDSKKENGCMNAGDISMHNPQIIHGSNVNASDQWRVGLTLRYIPTSTWVKREEHESIMFRGDVDPSVENRYAPKPGFDPEQHMSFSGCEQWR